MQSAADLEAAQAQLQEKAKELLYEQSQRESLKERYEREIKLMTTAWQVPVSVHPRASPHPLSGTSWARSISGYPQSRTIDLSPHFFLHSARPH